MKTSFKLDLSAMQSITRKMKDELDRDIEQVVMNTTRRVSLNAKGFAPVDKSGLKPSIRPTYMGKTGEVTVGVKYGPFLDFGTGSNVVIPQGWEDVASKYWTHKQWNGMRPQPYFYPAVNINSIRFNNDCSKAVGNVMNKRR